MGNKINVTTIGWWTWTFNVLYWLKSRKEFNLAAIVTVADNWWSTWELRDQFGILPPGDVRRAIVALSEDTWMVRKLFEYKFKKEWKLQGHAVWNILLTALADITGNFEEWIEVLCNMFAAKWKVIPVTLDDVNLWVELEDWQKIIGETNIDVPKHDFNLMIKEAFLIWEWRINPRAREALINSDYIIIWPGDLYTSIVPNLLVEWVKEALEDSNAKIIYVCNVMTKRWETNDFWVEDFIDIIEKYIWEDRIDYVLVNNWRIDEELVEKYKLEEWKKPVKVKDYEVFDWKKHKIIERDLVNEDDYIRHSPRKLSRAINDFIDWWIK